MTLFVVIGAVLALLSLALLMRPLWRHTRRSAQAPAEPAAVAALRQQLEQLTGLKASGVLGDKQYSEARGTLERRIADAVVGTEPVPMVTTPAQHPKTLALSVTAFVCVIAAGGYAVIGTPRALDPAAVAATATPAADGDGHSVTTEQIEAMIEKLAARMKDKPDDADGWAMLGRSYAVLGRFEQAAPAFKQAVALRGDDAVLLADYADALAVNNGRSLEGEPARLVDQALKLDPNNLKALSLAGTHAFNRKDYAQAIVHWEKLAKLAPDKELAQQVQGGIDEARRLAGGAAPAAAPAAAAAPASPAPAQAAAPAAALPGASVSGTVTLAPALAAKARPDDTLFVFARAVEGPRMPLAILRKQVKDLPLAFTLDDSMAMTPASRLSSVPRVVVGARVSASGSAMPQAGDLQGYSAPVAPGATQLKVEIAEIVSQ
jgi:cytochrome c-type biogenesis protein CcmH